MSEWIIERDLQIFVFPKEGMRTVVRMQELKKGTVFWAKEVDWDEFNIVLSTNSLLPEQFSPPSKGGKNLELRFVFARNAVREL